MPTRTLAGALFIFVLAPQPCAAQQTSAVGDEAPSPISSALSVSPGDVDLEAALAADPAAQAEWLQRLTVALAGEPGDLGEVQRQAAAILRLRGERLSRQHADWPDAQTDAFLSLLLIDQRRFVYDADFRANVVSVMSAALSEAVPPAARRRMVTRLSGFDFGPLEKIEVAWGLAVRSSRSREVPFDAIGLDYESQAPIRASIYSLPANYFRFDEAARFLRSVHAAAPQRRIVVLSNQPLIERLRPLAAEMPLVLLDSLGRPYSPWPRDPFFAVASARGPVTLVVRPNLQAQREVDVFMAREIIQNLPDEVDDEWRGVQWSVAPAPFHGGQTLVTPTTTWVSAQTLLPRVREILGLRDRIDLQKLRVPQVMRSFLAALDTAKAEFEEVFNRPVRFIHALPREGSDEEIGALLVVLGGADARDLDSIITIVESGGARPRALVGDLSLGNKIIGEAPDSDIRKLRELYHLQPAADELRRQLIQGHRSLPNQQFDAFLDASAAYLQRHGVEVERVPLIDVSQRLIPAEMGDGRPSFLLTWNNVVLQQVDGAMRAEGFASGMEVTDEKVREIFRKVGVSLDYIAPLTLSILRDGGYRCASNHVR